MAGQPKKDALPFIEFEGVFGQATRFFPDVVLSESSPINVITTDHPVGEGSPVTDHSRREPDTVSMEIFISNHPIRGDLVFPPGVVTPVPLQVATPPITPSLNSLAGAAIRSLSSGVTMANLLTFFQPFDRVKEAFELIQRLGNERPLLTVGLSYAEFPNMIMTSAEPSRDVNTGSGMALQLTFKHIKFVSSEVTFALPLVEPKEPRARPKQNEGQKDGQNAENNRSLLKSLVSEGFGG